jgi:UDP-N-acetylglucosamine 2-epimerase (non-hydrolysing)
MTIPVIHLIAGARPNFVKIAPLYHELSKNDWCEIKVVHTGQHSDVNMSDWFFRDLKMPPPDINLEIGSSSHAKQTGDCMKAYENLCFESRPQWTIVVGDVNSTIACALTAKKLGINVAHLEAGLRSFDMSMPEEINRVLTDRISDLLWTPSPDADANLTKEGISDDKIVMVGNIMIDSLVNIEPLIKKVNITDVLGHDTSSNYVVVTLHRPANVDNKETLEGIIVALGKLSKKIDIIFPVHPRTLKNLKNFSLLEKLNLPHIKLLKPLGYIDFLAVISKAKLLLTDSGGIQEETTYLGVPCLTLRPNTERPITIERGSNKLIELETLESACESVLADESKNKCVIDLWDGHTAERVSASLKQKISHE